MQYTHDVGVTANKKEIAALLEFCGEDENFGNISIRVRDGKLLAWAVDGSNAAYLHGDAFDGKGKPARIERDWQISLEMAQSLKRSMSNGDEVLLKTDKKLRMFEAEIRDEESGQPRIKIDLDGHVGEQLSLELTKYFPERPARDSGEIPCATNCLSWQAIARLKLVCKAAETDAIRQFVASTERAPIYVEIDKPAALKDDAQPRWVCVLAPSAIAEGIDEKEEKKGAEVVRTAVRTEDLFTRKTVSAGGGEDDEEDDDAEDEG